MNKKKRDMIPRVVEWQPIETAPEATQVLLFLPKMKHPVHIGSFDFYESKLNGKIIHSAAHWYLEGGTGLTHDDPEPTHWMLMPEHPK